jgi:hypothetical protein
MTAAALLEAPTAQLVRPNVLVNGGPSLPVRST